METPKNSFTSSFDPPSNMAPPLAAHSGALATRARSLARTLVYLASNGNDGSQFSKLNVLDGRTGFLAIRETIFLYLYLAGCAANALVDPDQGNAGSRDAFVRTLTDETIDLLIQTDGACFDEEVYRRDFRELCTARMAAFSGCTELYWQSRSSTKGTVVYEFFKNLTPFGIRIAVAVLANLQIAALEDACENALGTRKFTFPIAGQ